MTYKLHLCLHAEPVVNTFGDNINNSFPDTLKAIYVYVEVNHECLTFY